MKFAVDSNHREFFYKHHAIEFEALLDEKQLASLSEHIRRALSLRLKGGTDTPENLFMAGRDLFREESAIRKIVTQRLFAEIASELTQQKPLRLGYDQFIPPPPAPETLNYTQSPYFQMLKSQPTLQEIGPLQGVICGMMICLKGGAWESTPDGPTFSRKAGNAVFLSPLALVDFADLMKASGCSYLLIVYVQANAVYILNPADPNTHALKSYGYSLGDKLTDKLNPILFR